MVDGVYLAHFTMEMYNIASSMKGWMACIQVYQECRRRKSQVDIYVERPL